MNIVSGRRLSFASFTVHVCLSNPPVHLTGFFLCVIDAMCSLSLKLTHDFSLSCSSSRGSAAGLYRFLFCKTKSRKSYQLLHPSLPACIKEEITSSKAQCSIETSTLALIMLYSGKLRVDFCCFWKNWRHKEQFYRERLSFIGIYRLI